MSAISIIPERCTGCQSCEMACSLSHEGSCSPSLSRIRMKKWEEISVFMPVVCQQCEKPPCMDICPTGARMRVSGTEAVVTDEKRCVGCKSCIYACPYGAPALHPVTKRTMTCDLCQGSPRCTQVCTAGALSYVPEGDSSLERKRAFGQLFLHSMKPVARPPGLSLDLGRHVEPFDKLGTSSNVEGPINPKAGDLPGLALADTSSANPRTRGLASEESR